MPSESAPLELLSMLVTAIVDMKLHHFPNSLNFGAMALPVLA